MQFSQDFLQHKYIIRFVDATGFQVGDVFYPGSLLITHTHSCLPSPARTLEELTETCLAALMAQKPDIILIGTGQTTLFLPAARLAQCWEARVGIECMNTHAAARTYNVLANEGRRVTAVLMLGSEDRGQKTEDVI